MKQMVYSLKSGVLGKKYPIYLLLSLKNVSLMVIENETKLSLTTFFHLISKYIHTEMKIL